MAQTRRMVILAPQQAICGAFYALVGVWDVPGLLVALNRLLWPSVTHPWTVVALLWAGLPLKAVERPDAPPAPTPVRYVLDPLN